AIGPDLALALGGLRNVRNGGRVTVREHPPTDCSHAIELRAHLIVLSSDLGYEALAAILQDVKELDHLVDSCGDDALHAILAIGHAKASQRDADRAAAAVSVVPQDDLLAEVDLLRARHAGTDGVDTAIATYERAIERFGNRSRPRGQLRAVVEMIDVLLTRSKTADV